MLDLVLTVGYVFGVCSVSALGITLLCIVLGKIKV